MKNILKLIPIIILLSLLSSCKKLVQNNFNDLEKVPVVNSVLKADSTLVISLSYTASLNYGKIENIEDAVIRVFVDGTIQETLNNGENGMYTSNIIVVPGREYSCEIDIPDYDMLTCKAIIPQKSDILNIIHRDLAYTDEEGTISPAVDITFENDIHSNQYYEIIIKCLKKNWDGEEQNRYAWLVGIDDPLLINEGLPIAVFSNQIIQDSIYTMSLNYFTGGTSWNLADTHPLIIELRTINYDYYKYLKQLYLLKESINNDNLSGTTAPVQLYSNIENGYGIFAGYSNCIYDTIYPDNYQTY